MRSGASLGCAKAGSSRPPEAGTSAFTSGMKQLNILNMRLGLIAVVFATLLAACATSPPVQEMADARLAIQTAKEMPKSNLPAEVALKSAEQMLNDAAEAIRKEHYEQARQLALGAKRKAQKAVQYKQQK